MSRQLAPASSPPVFEEMSLLRVPWVEPVDISNAIVWLCSEEAGWVTGQLVFSDGGYALV